jgi:hypothetical protein
VKDSDRIDGWVMYLVILNFCSCFFKRIPEFFTEPFYEQLVA